MVCLSCEGIAAGESVTCCARFLEAAADMTHGVELSYIRVIYAEGILPGDSLLEYLGITGNCRIVLEHHHLLSAEIGAWPNMFGSGPLENTIQGGLYRIGEVV
jgi:hypothetical protein